MSDQNEGLRRRYWLRFARARAQLRYSLLLPSFALLSTVLFCVTGRIYAGRVLGAMTVDYGVPSDAIASVTTQMNAIFGMIMLSAGVVALTNIVMGITWSHRVFGPLVPIREHIERLKRGDTSARIALRKNDELKELELALNELTDVLARASDARR